MDNWFFTPSTVLFCFLNVIIITIFIASYSKSHKHQLSQHDSPQLNRSSSLLARVKSINLSFKNFDYHYPFQPETLLNDDHQNESHLTREVTPEDAEGVQHTSYMEEIKNAHGPAKTEAKFSVSEPLNKVSLKEKNDEVTTTGTVKERKKMLGVRELVKTVSLKGDEEVDAKADDFINRFKQQLKMQRLDSIKRYTEMLTRGARSSTN